MKKFVIMSRCLTIASFVSIVIWFVAVYNNDIRFDTNCGEPIRRASTAITVDKAKEELAKAISYAEGNGLTKGNTSTFSEATNDVGYWYQNLKLAYSELETVQEDATQLEKSNVLMKLKENLTTDSGDVRCPMWISIYPNSVVYFWWILVSCAILVLFVPSMWFEL